LGEGGEREGHASLPYYFVEERGEGQDGAVTAWCERRRKGSVEKNGRALHPGAREGGRGRVNPSYHFYFVLAERRKIKKKEKRGKKKKKREKRKKEKKKKGEREGGEKELRTCPFPSSSRWEEGKKGGGRFFTRQLRP